MLPFTALTGPKGRSEVPFLLASPLAAMRYVRITKEVYNFREKNIPHGTARAAMWSIVQHKCALIWAYVHPDTLTGPSGGLMAAGVWWRHAVRQDKTRSVHS